MSDDEQDPPEESGEGDPSEDAGSIADEVAAGVEAAGGEDDALAAEWAAAMEEAGEDESEDDESGDDESGDDVKAAPMEAFEHEEHEGEEVEFSPDLEVILDIPVRISMEVGHTHIAIRNLLQLNQGSVVELNRLAGEPLDVLVNGTLIAHGEVVMVNDKFGIRLTDVISQSERIQKIR